MLIERTTLERLLIDRALGEISPDADELLEAYLSREPEGRRLLAQINETVELAKRAVSAPMREQERLCPLRRVAHLEMNARWRRFRKIAVASVLLLACISSGFGLGYWLFIQDVGRPDLFKVVPTVQVTICPSETYLPTTAMTPPAPTAANHNTF